MSGRSVAGLSRSNTPSGTNLGTPQIGWLGEYGHALAGGIVPEKRRGSKARKGKAVRSWRARPEAKKALGAAINCHGSSLLFPNFCITGQHRVLRLPKGPFRTEIWWFCLLDRNLSPEENATARNRVASLVGAAGLLDVDDGENWGQSTLGAKSSAGRRYPLNYAMGLGRGEIIDDENGPPRIEASINEYAQFWLYRNWADWMAAESWDQLAVNHPSVPETVV